MCGFQPDNTTDLIIESRDGTCSHVHKFILFLQCPFFKNACDTSSNFQEAETGIIKMHAEAPDVVRCMLEFFYTQSCHYMTEYTADDEDPDTINRRALLHVDIYLAAEKYNIRGLKNVAERKIDACIGGGGGGGGDGSSKWITHPHFVDLIRYIYQETPDHDRVLRDIVLYQAKRCSDALMQSKFFDRTMDTIPGFWKDFTRAILDLPQEIPRTYICDDCGARQDKIIPRQNHALEMAHCEGCAAEKPYGYWIRDLLVESDDEGDEGDDESIKSNKAVMDMSLVDRTDKRDGAESMVLAEAPSEKKRRME